MLLYKQQRQNFLETVFLLNILNKIEKVLFVSQNTIFFFFWLILGVLEELMEILGGL